MKDANTSRSISPAEWFWFCSASGRWKWIQAALAIIAAGYFISGFADAQFWFTEGGPLSARRVATFLHTGGLQAAATWIVSPLFLAETAWIYYAYLIVGIVLAVTVAAGRGGPLAAIALWLAVVGWANRAMILSGLGETLLSLGLFAVAIGSLRPAWARAFAERLMAAQITVIGLATCVMMLAGRVWINGLGAYALAAPAEDRTIDWSRSLLTRPNVHELLTHALVIALPLGLVLAWSSPANRLGRVILFAWCLVVALLGSDWLYAASFAAMVLSISPVSRSPDALDRPSLQS